jgi:preprotein translocase subunit SecE
MRRFKTKLGPKFSSKLTSKLSSKLISKLSKPFNVNREEIKNNVLTIGLFIFIIITTFWLIDIVFGLLSDSMKFEEIKNVLLLIRDYVLWFVLAVLYIIVARKKHFNYESVIAFTALGSIYTAIKLYMADLGAVWIFIAEWIIITLAIYNIVKIVFSHLAKPQA